MDYRITINLNNAAFGNEGEGLELGRILRGIAEHCETMCCPWIGPLQDVNGNTVGKAEEIGSL